MRRLKGMVMSLAMRPAPRRTAPARRDGEQDCTARFIGLLLALVIAWLLLSLGCAAKPRPVFVDHYDAATVSVLKDERGVETYHVIHVTDRQTVDALRGYFRRVQDVPYAPQTGRVQPRAVVTFEHGEAGSFRVVTDYRAWTWARNVGRFPVAGDLESFIHQLQHPAPITLRE